MAEKEWNVVRCDWQEYDKIVKDKGNFFNEPAFADLNKERVEEVLYLIIYRGESARFAVIVGKDGEQGKVPFSAPYSYPVSIKPDNKVEEYDEGLKCLERYLYDNGIRELYFTFPPLFYDEHVLTAWISAFYRTGYHVTKLDLSYSIDLKKLNVDEKEYGELITQKGRKSLRKAMRNNLSVIRCETEEEYKEAYELVRIGHESKGYGVSLPFDKLQETLKLVDHDAFIVRSGSHGIVGEFLYKINDSIVHALYAGTHPDFLDAGGMNILTYHTIRYYGDLGYKIINKEASSTNSIPLYGLCNFKESVGCKRNLKFSFMKKIDFSASEMSSNE